MAVVLAGRGDTLIMGVELVEVAEGTHLRGERYTGKAEDLLSIQTAIAGEIARRLRVELTPDERQRPARGGTRSVEAYDLYLEGLHQWNRADYAGLNEAAA